MGYFICLPPPFTNLFWSPSVFFTRQPLASICSFNKYLEANFIAFKIHIDHYEVIPGSFVLTLGRILSDLFTISWRQSLLTILYGALFEKISLNNFLFSFMYFLLLQDLGNVVQPSP